MSTKYQYSKANQNSWEWLKDCPKGFEVVLHDGVNNVHVVAKRYNRKVKTKSLENGDFRVKVIE